MACSGVEGIRTAAAAADDDSVQFWKALQMHAHIGNTLLRACTHTLIQAEAQTVCVDRGVHTRARPYTCTYSSAECSSLSLSPPCSLKVSLAERGRQSLDSSSDLPCLIASCDLSCEISDTQTDVCLFKCQTLTPGRRRRWPRDSWTDSADSERGRARKHE